MFHSGLCVALLAAHPDDEAIGASSLLSGCCEPLVIYLTDGAPRNTSLWPPDFRGSREEYGQLRRAEAAAALAHAGVSPRQVEWLGGVDQEAIFEVERLTASLTAALERSHVDILITHPYEGGHPDHDAAALITSLATSRLAHDCLLLEMTSYHARHGSCATGTFLNSDPSREYVFELSAADRDRKRKMFDTYASQKLVLANFLLDREPLRPAPGYDFSSPPHEGWLWYERLGWEMNGHHWRALAAEAMNAIGARDAAHSA